jgi:putative holliday junction resolvase
MKIMCLDYGEKRVGVASTDESGTYALPRAVWPNTHDLLQKIVTFYQEGQMDRVVLGESKNLDGASNPIMEKVLKLKEELEAQGITVALHPEIFTTMEARQIQGNTDLTDASAAALILKSYLDSGYNV